MANKPVLFAVDDDPEVLRAVERDLRRKYGHSRNGDGCRILRADSAATAMDALGKLKLRGDPVALLLVDRCVHRARVRGGATAHLRPRRGAQPGVDQYSGQRSACHERAR
jgi:hypothetical protein